MHRNKWKMFSKNKVWCERMRENAHIELSECHVNEKIPFNKRKT